MKTPVILTLLLAGSVLVTPAWAGTASNPDLTDASGDATQNSVDVTSVWIENTATDVLFNIRVTDLTPSSPVFDNEGALHNYYRIEFRLNTNGALYFVEGAIHFVDSETEAGITTNRVGATVTTNVGTQFTAGRVGTTSIHSGTVDVDPAADLLILKLSRGSTFTAGAVLSQITIATSQNDDVHEAEGTLGSFIGGTRVLRDSGSTTKTVVI